MTDRERLIELIFQANEIVHRNGFKFNANVMADHLLANGVIVPPCNVGDSIFRVWNGEIMEWLIAVAYVYPDETIYADDSENEFTAEDIGKSIFLTKEEAEQALKGREG